MTEQPSAPYEQPTAEELEVDSDLIATAPGDSTVG